MANQLQTSLPRQAGENEVTWLTRIIKAIKTDIEYIASLFNKTYSGIFINGDGDTVTVDKGLIVSVEAPPLPFKLTWDDIGNALYTTVGDYNTALGSDFTTLTVDGNDQLLTGNSTTFDMPTDIFKNNVALVTIDDTAESCTSVGENTFGGCTSLTAATLAACTSVGEGAFQDCPSLTAATLAACTSVGDNTFRSCTSLTSVILPLCADLGGTTGDDSVFLNISGQTITLTIPTSRQTCNGGAPDGDIVDLAANNTATIIYV